MILEEFCDFFKDKETHYDESTNFVKDGYGQLSGGYIEYAKCKKVKVDVNTAEPNQKWHLLESYYREYDSKKEAKKIINSGEKRARNKAGRKIKEEITWEKLEAMIRKASL